MVCENIPEPAKILDGYFVGFVIPQISNEFDLLRFGNDYIVNIELKGKLNEKDKLDIIKTQMKKQYYYLKFLEKPLKIYTYIEDEGFYFYNIEDGVVEFVQQQIVIDTLVKQTVNFDLDPDVCFKPSNYFVSPFNKVERFMLDEYFLTPDQAKKKKEIEL